MRASLVAACENAAAVYEKKPLQRPPSAGTRGGREKGRFRTPAGRGSNSLARARQRERRPLRRGCAPAGGRGDSSADASAAASATDSFAEPAFLAGLRRSTSFTSSA